MRQRLTKDRRRGSGKQKQTRRRITLSVSADVVAYLQEFKRRSAAPSLSAAVDEMVAQFKMEKEKLSREALLSAYYDSLSQEEMNEDAAWGRLGAGTLEKIKS